MKIAFLASEVAPYAKTGGLADVSAALPKALSQAGLDLAVFLPFYRDVQNKGLTLIKVLDNHPLTWKGAEERFSVWADLAPAYPVCFIENNAYFVRDSLYGYGGDYTDNGERFAFFAKAALEAMKALPFEADVIHANDWQTAPALAYLKHVYAGDDFYARTRSVFTIHNLAYHGLFDPGILDWIGLPAELFRMEDLEFYGRVSFIKAGILYADAVTTVSPRYAREIQTEAFGFGLDGLLRRRANVLTGVLNGIDSAEWDPGHDACLPARYTLDDLTGKAACKRELLRAFDLVEPRKDVPLVGVVSRLVEQKGVDILLQALGGLFSSGFKLVVLGTGSPDLEDALRSARERYPSFLGLKIGFNEGLARMIYGGADLFLIPSRFEPCGLTQMISMKYGTIPVVRAVGGLDDSVVEFDPAAGTGTGFKFASTDAADLIGAVRRAAYFYGQKPLWAKLVRNVMAVDFSWDAPARRYAELYASLKT